ncbi:MAG: urocanate hydratase, partial [Muribaculaceae bacterium]|nr:urocanate hydratase [Muribaculaceae bacterium]
MTIQEFRQAIAAGIPDVLPAPRPYDPEVNHAPRRKDILTPEEKRLALRNALRYFDPKHHAELAPEFADELNRYGRIYMYRFRPDYAMYARPIDEYPARSRQAAAIMLMIQNNLDPRVAQHPHELITYGGNGAVFQNWAQYLLVMKYLSEMTDDQTLVMYSGHPLGLFPSHPGAPRVVVTNGMVIPNYSGPDDWERFNALGVSQYGQMTAGSYMYIGPQG